MAAWSLTLNSGFCCRLSLKTTSEIVLEKDRRVICDYLSGMFPVWPLFLLVAIVSTPTTSHRMMIGKGNKPIYVFFRKDETGQFARRICCGGWTNRENDVGMAAPDGFFPWSCSTRTLTWKMKMRKICSRMRLRMARLGSWQGWGWTVLETIFFGFCYATGHVSCRLPQRCQCKPQIGQAKGGYGQTTKGGAIGLLFFVEPGLWSLWIILDHGLSMDSVGSLGISFDNWIPGDSAFLWLTLWGRRCRFLEPK